jgi:hypothetical protein
MNYFSIVDINFCNFLVNGLNNIYKTNVHFLTEIFVHGSVIINKEINCLNKIYLMKIRVEKLEISLFC